MIVEGLVTTTNPDGAVHLAPMGPIVSAGFRTLTLRPFPTSQTCRNLLARGEGVFHVTDDAGLIARAALGKADPPAAHPARSIRGFLLADHCRAYEFRVREMDRTGERVVMVADLADEHLGRDFLGFNRAKHAVIEAAIILTRLHLLPRGDVEAEFRKFRVIVGKTGGDAEREAMTFLDAELAGTP